MWFVQSAQSVQPVVSASSIEKTITYTPVGKQRQTYTIKGNHIFNKEGKEVFKEDSKDRRAIFANLAIQDKRAVMVEYHGNQYVVNNKGQILSVRTKDLMKWGEENGDRKAILEKAHQAFENLKQQEQVLSVTQQLVDHINKILKKPVHGKADMEKYLREHGYGDILEARRAFSKDYPYHNDDKASEEERKEILDIIKGKKYNKAGTDAVTLDSNGHQVIYLIDHSSDSELYENLKDGEGFGIRNAYDVSNITKKDIYEIVRNISIQYGNSEERILRVLSRLGIRQGNLPGSDIVDAVRRGIRSHAVVYGGTGETRSQLGNNRSGINGREDSRDISFFLGRKARERYRNIIEKTRPDLDEEQVRSTLDFLHSLEDSKENTAYIKAAMQWIANGSITLPRDHQVAMDIFTKAKNKHVDISKYPTMSQLLKSDEFKPKKEKISFTPDKEKTFSNHKTVTTNSGRTFEVYDVENTSEGQRAVCHALAANYEASPWCLSTFTATGEPTESAKRFWHNYEAIPRKIAFEDGKPVAFSSSAYNKNPEAWWDLNDTQEQYELSDNINSTNRNFINVADFNDFLTPNDLDLAEQREQYIKDNIKAAKTVKEFKNTVTEALQGKMSFSDFFKNTIVAEYYSISRESEESIIKKFLIERNAYNQNIELNPFPSDNSIKELAKIAIEKGTEVAKKEIDNLVNKEHEEIKRKRAEESVKRESDNIKSVLRNSNISEERFINKIKSLYAFQAGSDSFRLAVEEKDINNASSVEDYVRILNDWGKGALLSIAVRAAEYGLNSVTNDTYNEFLDNSLPFFTTPEGEIYGFVTPEGEMYLDETKINPEHPLHEYTHLWDMAIQKRNPKLWKQGISLMQQFDNGNLWNEIARSEQYGKRWQSQGLKGEQLINRIASEVHARLVGENGAKLLDEIAKKKGQKGIVAQLREWILDVWKDLKATFSDWSDEEIQKLTLKDFNHMTVRDFADAVNLKEIPSSQNTQSASTINSQSQRSNVEVYHGNWSRSDVEKQTDKVFLFGDNTNDRLNTHHVPSMTQAVIRGLPNAIGIDTKKNRGMSADSYFTDADFDTFKAQVDDALQKAIDSGKIIVIPEGGIGTGRAMLKQKAPKLFKYLQEQLNKIQNGQAIQQRGVVQPTLSGNLEIRWQGRGREYSENSQEGKLGNSQSNSSRGSRTLDNVEAQVFQVSDALDQRLADKGIKVTKQRVRKANSQEFQNVRKLVHSGFLEDMCQEYAEYGLSLKRIAKEIGCSTVTALKTVNYAIENGWLLKHKHCIQYYAKGVSYMDIPWATFSTKNNIYVIQPNTYELTPVATLCFPWLSKAV